MDALKLHLLMNYYPAIGVVIGTVVLAAGFWFGNVRAKRFALKLIFVMAILTVGVGFSGEFASWSIDPQTKPSVDALEAHKINATVAFAAVLGTGIASLVGLIRGRVAAERPTTTYVIVLIFAMVSSALLIATILKGRQVKWATNLKTETLSIVHWPIVNWQQIASFDQLTIRQLTMNNWTSLERRTNYGTRK